MAQYGSIFSLKESSHNIEVGMEILGDANIMEEFENKLHEKIYGIVPRISSNIDYRDQNENVINQEFNQMITVGNLEANSDWPPRSTQRKAKGRGKRKSTRRK